MRFNILIKSLFALALLFLSCKSPTDIKIDNQIETEKELIPTAIGNYWIYTDSAQTKFDTVSIVGKYDSLGYTWWRLKNNSFAMEDFSSEFAKRNDTIFEKTTAGLGGREMIRQKYILPGDSTISYGMLRGCESFERKATLHKKQITIPAGTFHEFISYADEKYLSKDSVVIVPGVGVIFRILEYYNYQGVITYSAKSFLKSYYLSD